MALPLGETPPAQQSRALEILAKTMYRELLANGFEPRHVIALAGELLGLVTDDVKSGATGGP